MNKPFLYKLVVWCEWYGRGGRKVGRMRRVKVMASSYNEAERLAVASVPYGTYVAYGW